MDAFLNRFWWLKSKKFWAFIGSFVTITGAALQVEPFPYADYTLKVVILAGTFMGANALEDGMKAKTTANISKPEQVVVAGDVRIGEDV